MTKKVLIVCPDMTFWCLLFRAVEDLEETEGQRGFSFNDGLNALEREKPDLVVTQIDYRDEGRFLPFIEKLEELKIYSVIVICNCLNPLLANIPGQRVTLQWLGCGLIDKIEAAAREFLGQ